MTTVSVEVTHFICKHELINVCEKLSCVFTYFNRDFNRNFKNSFNNILNIHLIKTLLALLLPEYLQGVEFGWDIDFSKRSVSKFPVAKTRPFPSVSGITDKNSPNLPEKPVINLQID